MVITTQMGSVFTQSTIDSRCQQPPIVMWSIPAWVVIPISASRFLPWTFVTSKPATHNRLDDTHTHTRIQAAQYNQEIEQNTKLQELTQPPDSVAQYYPSGSTFKCVLWVVVLLNDWQPTTLGICAPTPTMVVFRDMSGSVNTCLTCNHVINMSSQITPAQIVKNILIRAPILFMFRMRTEGV